MLCFLGMHANVKASYEKMKRLRSLERNKNVSIQRCMLVNRTVLWLLVIFLHVLYTIPILIRHKDILTPRVQGFNYFNVLQCVEQQRRVVPSTGIHHQREGACGVLAYDPAVKCTEQEIYEYETCAIIHHCFL
jgi:hypothetical protein